MSSNHTLRFSLGRVLATPAALDALAASGEEPRQFLDQHVSGKWGDELCQEDKALNDAALVDGSRILSCYRTRLGVRLYIITEAEEGHGNRVATTILLPEEY